MDSTISELFDYGLTENEIIDLIVSIDIQHGNSYSVFDTKCFDFTKSQYYGLDIEHYQAKQFGYKKDFAHETIQYAMFANDINPLRIVVDKINSDIWGVSYTNYEGSFKGDIDSHTTGSIDYATDIDGIACYYWMINSDADSFDVWIDYNYQLQHNEINMAEEFLIALGEGSTSEGLRLLHEILEVKTFGSNYIRDSYSEEQLTESLNAFWAVFMEEYEKISE